MKISKKKDIPLLISPHYYFPSDLDCKQGGALEHAMHNIYMFERVGQLDLTNFAGSAWLCCIILFVN